MRGQWRTLLGQLCDRIMIDEYVEVFTHDVMLHYGYVLVQYTTRNCTTTFCHMDHDCNMRMHDWLIYLRYATYGNVMMHIYVFLHICYSLFSIFIPSQTTNYAVCPHYAGYTKTFTQKSRDSKHGESWNILMTQKIATSKFQKSITPH